MMSALVACPEESTSTEYVTSRFALLLQRCQTTLRLAASYARSSPSSGAGGPSCFAWRSASVRNRISTASNCLRVSPVSLLAAERATFGLLLVVRAGGLLSVQQNK